MTVRVTPKMRKKIDAMKEEKELVTDNLYRDIHNRKWIYTSPDGGKTIHRRPTEPYVDGNPDYDDVSGVRLDKKPTNHGSFAEIFDRLNNIEREIRSLRNRFMEMERNNTP